jgi:deoxyribodipyrimidine photo-lyase
LKGVNILAVIVLIRNDFRLHDHASLYEARKEHDQIYPLFVYDTLESLNKIGSAQKWWLHHTLNAFQKSLEEIGSQLWIREGNLNEVLTKFIDETEAKAVYWNRVYTPETLKKDRKMSTQLHDSGIEVRTFESTLFFPPWEIKKENNEPYKVFSAFHRAFLKKEVPKPLPNIRKLTFTNTKVKSLPINDLELLPKIPWDSGFEDKWDPSEKEALHHYHQFTKKKLTRYVDDHDFPSLEGTSELSPYLAFGQISVRTIYYDLMKESAKGADSFIRQLVWREFSYSLLLHFPHTIEKPLVEKFEPFEWNQDASLLEKWQKGMTGYPIVDAGMRELWVTGYMHNRVRMVVASFLTKHLLIHWKEGARWFSDTLVDADLANNTMGWQWVAGSGADAAPYFRIFNPILQGEKFDFEGNYIRKWIPELSKLPNKVIHKPFEANDQILVEAGVILGETYPKPIVDHKAARERALERYNLIK